MTQSSRRIRAASREVDTLQETQDRPISKEVRRAPATRHAGGLQVIKCLLGMQESTEKHERIMSLARQMDADSFISPLLPWQGHSPSISQASTL